MTKKTLSFVQEGHERRARGVVAARRHFSLSLFLVLLKGFLDSGSPMVQVVLGVRRIVIHAQE